ncbi:hypothetical protein Acsp06_46190 [Actinomycetospora sp. NBRC 106375]|uniref:DUF2235 domain-containing protein n=1 Tax=Actinomycetospora sp. NBRC 106375 TaxID=3032207 RepID=UPI0024A226F4|nr:DUF2235 domain-containing protein [Actinomycetospora sp. NBRC 106375]GLZ48434.1 hypothetical protein Acsp06_46190 [Actinomycetospora sp. NBRC 106375]
MKRLVVCCDGTWNTPDEVDENGAPCPSNISRIAQAVAEKAPDGTAQRLFYDKGVGTNGRLDRVIGGVFGRGVAKNVRDAYHFLVDVYEPGDEIFFFGFSRGAFTARSAAGFVRNCGILRREHAYRLDDAFALYRARDPQHHPTEVEAALFRRSFSHVTRIRFIGVFDTVGSLGVPLTGLPLTDLANRRYRFHDTALSGQVDGAFQALAMHERRGSFVPALWTGGAEGQEVEQVWFTGVHSDVGGGYSDHRLADITLAWMAARARRYGLALHLPDDLDPDALGRRHVAMDGVYRWLPRRPRSPVDGTSVASSVVDRQRRFRDAPRPFRTMLGDPARRTTVEHVGGTPEA